MNTDEYHRVRITMERLFSIFKVIAPFLYLIHSNLLLIIKIIGYAITLFPQFLNFIGLILIDLLSSVELSSLALQNPWINEDQFNAHCKQKLLLQTAGPTQLCKFLLQLKCTIQKMRIEYKNILEYLVLVIISLLLFSNYSFLITLQLMQNSHFLSLSSQFAGQGIQAPEAVTCLIDLSTNTYISSFTLTNKSSQSFHIAINSTFFNYFETNYNDFLMASGQSKQIKIKLRPPNQVFQNQFLSITYTHESTPPICSVFDQDSNYRLIKLHFSEGQAQDQQMSSILEQCSECQLNEAIDFYKKGCYSDAVKKAEQAFVLCRKNIKCLVVMAEAELGLGNKGNANRQIEIVLYIPQSTVFYKAILIKCSTVYHEIKQKQFARKQHVLNSMIKFVKNIIMTMMQEPYEKMAHSLIQSMNAAKSLLDQNQDKQIVDLFTKAGQRFDDNQLIKKHFLNKDQLKVYLFQLLKKEKKEMEETPQYALDPINYEIFVNPVIVPSGLSYQKQVVRTYFQIHGPQDPLTRTYLDPNSIVNNITLKILVRNNPQLPKWLKYEERITKL